MKIAIVTLFIGILLMFGILLAGRQGFIAQENPLAPFGYIVGVFVSAASLFWPGYGLLAVSTKVRK
jgi:uncharacterized membrane protein YdjX (TVP38/TMEM64 family)